MQSSLLIQVVLGTDGERMTKSLTSNVRQHAVRVSQDKGGGGGVDLAEEGERKVTFLRGGGKRGESTNTETNLLRTQLYEHNESCIPHFSHSTLVWCTRPDRRLLILKN